MNLLSKYKNGNVTVTLLSDGTKIQEWSDDEAPNPTFPVSCDVKITDWCDAGCKFCHEQSTTKGIHGDLSHLLKVLKPLPGGTELALGGGNPLDHPQLFPFLEVLKMRKIIPNLTVNYKHLKQEKYMQQVNHLLENNLIYGLGVSIPDDYDEEVMNQLINKSNVVYHVIAGVNDLVVLDKIKTHSSIRKCLILGYKTFGRGEKYYSPEVQELINQWKEHLGHYIRKMHLSFDNLAITQLEVKNHLSDEEWKKFFMGNDGEFTMYLDAVKQEFGLSSTSKTRYKIEGPIDECFTVVKEGRIAKINNN